MDTRSAVANDELAGRLEESRQRTRWLLRAVSDEDLSRQHGPIMRTLIWDYGHIGNYEELWLLEKDFGKSLSNRDLYDIYDASLHSETNDPAARVPAQRDYAPDPPAHAW